MKAIITALVVVGAVVVGVYFLNNRSAQVYERENTVEVIPEVKEQWQTDEDAIQAAKDVIKKKELQAELKQLDEDIKAKQEQRKKVADELTTY